MPRKWDKKTDVVIVGYGAAGATAAITSHDLGANVLIMEKMPVGGGNTATSEGVYLCPSNLIASIKYFKAMSVGHEVEIDTVHTLVKYMTQNVDWFKKISGPSAESVQCLLHLQRKSEHPNLLGSEGVQSYALRINDKRARGLEMFNLLADNVKSRAIEVLYNTPAKQLLTNSEGEVIGVAAESRGEKITIEAKRAVILTCGGFENNKEMIANYLCYTWTSVCFAGTPGNTGDGIKMAQKVGAGLWHMNNPSGPFFGLKLPEYENAMSYPPIFGWNFICVNKYGKRFGLEKNFAVAWVPPYVSEPKESRHGKGMEQVFYCDYSHSQYLDYPNVPFYLIFDEATRQHCGGGQRTLVYKSSHSAPIFYRWSAKFNNEIEKKWIFKEETVNMLAMTIGVNPATLEETIRTYNKYCKEGKDPDYLRPKETLIPIETPPYYAMELWPTILNTQGGPKRNAKCQVLDPYGQPIPRLYSAGELGSIFGFLYNGGGNLGECFATGRIAGENAFHEHETDRSKPY